MKNTKKQTPIKKAFVSAKSKIKSVRSPFRYAGGKSWFVNTASDWLRNKPIKSSLLVEPFAGGANISLSSVAKGLVESASFCELDPDVAAAWKCMLNGHAEWLAKRITEFRVNRSSVGQQLKAAVNSEHERAFVCLLRNRMARGGILAEGAGLLRKGENRRGLRSR